MVNECGVSNGEHYCWVVGDDDGVPEGYIGREKCDLIDDSLREVGLKNGETINLVSRW